MKEITLNNELEKFHYGIDQLISFVNLFNNKKTSTNSFPLMLVKSNHGIFFTTKPVLFAIQQGIHFWFQAAGWYFPKGPFA